MVAENGISENYGISDNFDWGGSKWDKYDYSNEEEE